MQELFIDNIQIKLTKKPIKNLYIRVDKTTGEVSVSAPLLCSIKSIKKFVHSKHDWIVKSKKNSILKNKEFVTQAKRSFVDGETFSIWGIDYSLKNITSKKYKIFTDSRTNVLYFKSRINSSALSKLNYLKEWYREILLEKSFPIIDKYEKLTGLKSGNIVTRFTKSVWGTCQKKSGRIMLNTNLAKLDIKFLDYIILHEICHLKYSGHGEKFKNMQTKFLPNWKEISKDLKKFTNLIADPYIV